MGCKTKAVFPSPTADSSFTESSDQKKVGALEALWLVTRYGLPADQRTSPLVVDPIQLSNPCGGLSFSSWPSQDASHNFHFSSSLAPFASHHSSSRKITPLASYLGSVACSFSGISLHASRLIGPSG